MPSPRNSLPNLRASDITDAEAPAADTPLRLVAATPPGPDAVPASPEAAIVWELRALRAQVERLVAEQRALRARDARLVVRADGKMVFLRVRDVEWVEAAGNYVRVHAGGASYLLRESMKNMETRLDPETFVRIHRSAIVNVDYIHELEPWVHGEFVVLLRSGRRLMASRVFSDRLARLIG